MKSFNQFYNKREFPFQIPLPSVFSTIDSFSKNFVHTCIDSHHALPPQFPKLGAVKRYAQSEKLHYSFFQWKDQETDIL